MSPTCELKEKLEQYVQRVKDRCEDCRDNEAQTKAALIAPLFTILGYDMSDPQECKQEYKADFGEGRGKEPVDWAFCVNSALAFLVEAKAVGKKIDRYDEQLGDYYAKEHGALKLGILTTGVQWRFFTDLVADNLMDNEPFLEWDVLKDAIPDDFLTVLQREKFNPDLIKTFARGKRQQSILVEELNRLLEPSDEFVRLAIQNKERLLETRNLNAKVIQEWKPILVSAIHEWVQQQKLAMALGRANDAPAEDQPHPPQTGTPRPEKHRDSVKVSLKDVIDAGLLKPPLKLTVHYEGADLEADLLADGSVRFQGKTFKTCSAAGEYARSTITGHRMSTNGWVFWRCQDEAGTWVPLDVARQKYMGSKAK